MRTIISKIKNLKNENDYESFYPYLINDIMSYIERIKMVKGQKVTPSLTEIIMDYSLKKDIPIEMIGDAIASDEYFKSFIMKDCEVIEEDEW